MNKFEDLLIKLIEILMAIITITILLFILLFFASLVIEQIMLLI